MKHFLYLALLSTACQSGRAALDGPPSDVDSGSLDSDTGMDAQDEDEDEDDQEPKDEGEDEDEDEDEPEPEDDSFPYAAKYLGIMDFSATTEWGWGDLELEACDTWVDVSENGSLEGESLCLQDTGWGDPDPYLFVFEGDVDDDGDFTGSTFYEPEWKDSVSEFGLEGTISKDGTLVIECAGTYEVWSTDYEVTGSGVLEAD